jgi:alanyl-tRNA synthetase
MGDTGPCGPCSEIHVDLRSAEEISKIPGKELVNKDHPQVIEIWNLVFMEFNRMASGELIQLPAKHVDTGMGFERLAMVLQGKQSNYDTDVFSPLIEKITQLTGVEYNNSSVKSDVAIRVIADHIRAVAFAIADGQLPSNTGAGYVIRRILRRGIRYGYSFLNTKEPFINQLVEVLVNQMGEFFPELIAQQDLITKVIKEEEESFLRTLAKGIQRFEHYLVRANDKMIDGKFAFELYDTFGFPIDLTRLLAEENKFHIDISGFTNELLKQKERSRAATKVEADDWLVLQDDDVEEFIGYDYQEASIFITKYRKITTKEKELYQLVFNLTPFYPEGGGQVGDVGYIEANGEKVAIVDTKRENNLIIHFSEALPQDVNVKFKAFVEKSTQKLTACNHTATHLMHHALREVLGTHVEQKGSLVNAKYLRFDFSHFEKVSDEQLKEIENIVNSKIHESIALKEHRAIPLSMAEDQGAMMLFGEKYGDVVRMIEFGESKELCGGIHAENTKEIELFNIKSEGAIAAGIRRIEALTSKGAGEWIDRKIKDLDISLKEIAYVKEYVSEKTIQEVKQIRDEYAKSISKLSYNLNEGMDAVGLGNKSNVTVSDRFKAILAFLTSAKVPKEIIDEISSSKKKFEKQGQQDNKAQTQAIKEELLANVEVLEGINVIAQKIELTDSGAIKDLAFQLKGQVENLFLVLGAEVNGKPSLTIVISDDLAKEKDLHAGNIIREAAKEMRGGGGGQLFFATAGGSNVEGIEAAIVKAKSYLS